MKDRIFELIESKGYNITNFADEIGIERATMSHIKTGRSKPTLTQAQKILEHFPEVSPDWLILGHGSMYREKSKPETSNFNPQLDLFGSISGSYVPVEPQKTEPTQPAVQQTVIEQQAPAVAAAPLRPTPPPVPKKIERIIVLYSDNTFETLTN